MAKPMTVEICMGSSCYSRGNSESLPLIEQFVATHSDTATVELKGSLCMNACSKGPTLIINGKRYNGVHPNCVQDLLTFHLGETV